jgi:hypothetical protein
VGFEADWPTWGSGLPAKDIGINNQAVPAFGIFITVLAVNYLGEVCATRLTRAADVDIWK